MAIKKVRMRPKGSNDHADILHPETSADNILDTSTKVIMTSEERARLADMESILQNLSADAIDITYDNTESGLSATNVQAAIDEAMDMGALQYESDSWSITEDSVTKSLKFRLK